MVSIIQIRRGSPENGSYPEVIWFAKTAFPIDWKYAAEVINPHAKNVNRR